jgi:hypothetical protein
MLVIDKIYMLVNLISSWKGLVNKYRKEYMAIHLLLLFFLPSLEFSYSTFLQHPNKQKQINYTSKGHVYVLYDNINRIPRLHIQTLNFQGSFSLYYASWICGCVSMVHPHQRCFQEYSLLLLVAYCGRLLQGQYQESQRTHVSIQQQQHSLLSQASWGRLEMKPKRDEKQGDT